MEYHKHDRRPPRSYTIRQMKDHAERFVRLNPVRNDLTPQLYLSLFIESLAKREREKEGGG